jgi:hypothetical protein
MVGNIKKTIKFYKYQGRVFKKKFFLSQIIFFTFYPKSAHCGLRQEKAREQHKKFCTAPP